MTGDHDLLRRAARLAERGELYALATVVARTPPSSARPGARALVEADGTFHGWLGGSCIEPTVRREALAALRDGDPRLVVFAPGGEADRPGAVVHPMTCHSGGTVEVHVDPQLPAPALLLFGDSPVTRALAAMAPAAGWRVRAVGVEAGAAAWADAEVVERGDAAEGAEDAGGSGRDEGGEPSDDVPAGGADVFAVVATMGEWDEDAVREALDAGAGYVGLVASPRRAEQVGQRVAAGGDAPGDRLVSPAGLDLGAREPGEIAVTILAELVQRRRSGPSGGATGAHDGGSTARSGERADGDGAASRDAGSAPDASGAPDPVDPVCGMTVDPDRAHPRLEHDGETYHFCCDGCRSAFRDEPERYAATGAP